MSNFKNISRAKLSAAGRASVQVRRDAVDRVERTVKPGGRARSIRGGVIYTITTVEKSGTGRDYRIRLNTGSEYTPTRFWEVFELV